MVNRRAHRPILLALVVLALASTSCAPPPGEFEFVSSTLWTRAYDVEVRDDHAYCSFLNGLVILDVSKSDAPQMVSQLFLGGGFGLDVVGELAYIAAGEQGLRVVDVSDPSSPTVLGVLETPGEAKDVVVREDRAYAAVGDAGLVVVDIADPASPSITGSVDTPGYAESLELVETLVYLADGAAGLQVADVGSSGDPVLIGGFDTPGNAEDIAVSGERVYVADGSAGLQVIDIGTPSLPRLESTFATAGYAHGIAVRGEAAFVGGLYDGNLHIVDISDPASPSQIAVFSYHWPNEAWDVAIDGDLAYVVDYFSGIFVVDIGDLANPDVKGFHHTPAFLVDVEVVEDKLYSLGQERYGLATVDFADPANPRLLGMTGGVRFPMGVAVRGATAYVTGRGPFLYIADVSDPNTPEVLAQVAVPGVSRAVKLRGNHAYLTSDHSGFHIVDVSDPASATITGSVETAGFSYDLAIHGDLAYVANSEFGLQIIDISDPKNPKLEAEMATPGNAYGLAIQANHAYLADGESGLHIVDISDPSSPAMVSSLGLGGFINAVAAAGEFVYVTDEEFGVRKIRVSDPAAPVVVASYDTPGEPTEVAVSSSSTTPFLSWCCDRNDRRPIIGDVMSSRTGAVVIVLLLSGLMVHCGGGNVNLSRSIPMSAAGWQAGEEDETYDRDTLYGYMNGGAEVYLAFDFREVFVRRYGRDGAEDIVLDVYDMGSPAEAYGVFSCDREDPEAGIGQGSEYGFGLLRFWQSRFFVTIMTTGEDEAADAAILDLGRAVADELGPDGEPPAMLRLLPTDGLIDDRTSYFHSNINLNNRYFSRS
jgi:hypothetical protein